MFLDDNPACSFRTSHGKRPSGWGEPLCFAPLVRLRHHGFDLWRKRLIVRFRSPPLDGRANREVEEIIGGITGMKTVVKSGAADRRKTVLVEGDADAAAERLGDAL